MSVRQPAGRMLLMVDSSGVEFNAIQTFIQTQLGLGLEMEFQYNPQTIKDSWSANWSQKGRDDPEMTFDGNPQRILTMQLLLNDYGAGDRRITPVIRGAVLEDARRGIAKFERFLAEALAPPPRALLEAPESTNVEASIGWLRLMMRKPAEEAQSTGFFTGLIRGGATTGDLAPVLILFWKRGDPFRCVVTDMDIEYQVLEPRTLRPLRAVVDLTLTQFGEFSVFG